MEGAAVVGARVEGQAPVEGGLAAEPAAPKEPSPFELNKDFPPDGAEVPFVKSFEASPVSAPEPPKPVVEETPKEPEPTPAEAPVEVPAEQPAAEAPIEAPVEAPVETPAETPAEQPAQEEAPAPAE